MKKKGSLNTIFERRRFGARQRRESQKADLISESAYSQLESKVNGVKQLQDFVEYIQSDKATQEYLRSVAASMKLTKEHVESILQEVYMQTATHV